ncbi:histidine phosphatase family protein [Coprothermobacter platensis]|uniref:histidine phosphatase family protein n=1 Tax=Coprothermobacter platensis TaxID=108819 RepID=UPI0003679B3A|nr:histidine phosphatase family protein [Coprothermobacter platensis]
MRIYLLRHPETDWNGEWRFQGRTDIPISEKGMKSLEQALPVLCSLPVETLYTSPLKRAKIVAEKISEKMNIPFKEDARIIEAHCGEWEGRRVPDLMKEEPDLLGKWWKNPYLTPMPGGETYQQVEQRTSAFLEEVIEQGKNALVVSHGIAITTMLRYILDLPQEKTGILRIENLGLAKIEIDDLGKGFVISNPAGILDVLTFPL